jgi:hypothetical protein
LRPPRVVLERVPGTWNGVPAPALGFPVDEVLASPSHCARLAGDGFVKIAIDRRLRNDEFIPIGRHLGVLVPETAPAVATFVQDLYILKERLLPPELHARTRRPPTMHTS